MSSLVVKSVSEFNLDQTTVHEYISSKTQFIHSQVYNISKKTTVLDLKKLKILNWDSIAIGCPNCIY